MNKLVISLATLIFGAVGVLVSITRTDTDERPNSEIVLTMLVLLFAALALYFSYATYDSLVEMLSNEFVDLNGPMLSRPRVGQVYSLIAAVVLFGFLVARQLTPSRSQADDDEPLE